MGSGALHGKRRSSLEEMQIDFGRHDEHQELARKYQFLVAVVSIINH